MHDLAAAEEEQLAREIGGALGGGANLAEALDRVGRQVRRLAGQLGLQQDHRENVVEIVRDAAGELADGVHLLRLPELLLHPQPFRDFAHVAMDRIDLGEGIERPRERPLPVRRLDAQLRLGGGQAGVDQRARAGWEHGGEIRRAEGLHQRGGGAVVVGQRAVGGEGQHGVRVQLREGRQPPNRVLGGKAFRGVAHHADEIVALVLNVGEGNFDRERRAVLALMNALKRQRTRRAGGGHVLLERARIHGRVDVPHGFAKHLRMGIAQVHADLFIEVQEPARDRIDHLDGVLHAVDQRAEELERGRGAAALRGVAAHPEHGGDFAVRIPQRAGVGLQPAPRAFESGDLKFEDRGFAAQHAFDQPDEGRAIFRDDERIDALTPHISE